MQLTVLIFLLGEGGMLSEGRICHLQKWEEVQEGRGRNSRKTKGPVHLVMGKGRGREALQEKMSPFCTFSLCVRACDSQSGPVLGSLSHGFRIHLCRCSLVIWVIKHLSQNTAVSIPGEGVCTAHSTQPDLQQARSMGKLF